MPFYRPKTNSPARTPILQNHQRRHPHFWFDDGDLLLEFPAMDFRVHSDRLLHRSTFMASLFPRQAIRESVDSIMHWSLPYDEPEDWACFLGLIYDEQGNSVASPTMCELLGTLRVANKYAFTRIEGWAMAHMRADFFPNIQHFQDDDDSRQAEDKILNSLAVVKESHLSDSPFETATLALAYYALARRDLTTAINFINTMEPLTWKKMLRGRRAMEWRFEAVGNTLIKIARRKSTVSHLSKTVGSTNAVSHCPGACERSLDQWVADFVRSSTDVLEALKQMQQRNPSGPVCPACLCAARKLADKEMLAISRDLPLFFEYNEVQESGWDLSEERKQFLRRSFRP